MLRTTNRIFNEIETIFMDFLFICALLLIIKDTLLHSHTEENNLRTKLHIKAYKQHKTCF